MTDNFKGVLDAYAARIPDCARIERVYPEARNEEIRGCASEKVRIQKYYAWKLLEAAAVKSFGADFNTLAFGKDKNGKWSCNGMYFSLSHSAAAVAVAVSDKPVGIDIELARTLPCEKLAKKILTVNELSAFNSLKAGEREGFLLERWTRKESLFKRSGICAFSQTDADGQAFLTETLEIKGERYVLSVCGDTRPFRLFLTI